MDLVLLVDFFPETLQIRTTLWLRSAGKTSVDARATVRKTLTVHSYREQQTCVVVFVFLAYKTSLHKQEFAHLLQFSMSVWLLSICKSKKNISE